MIPCTGPYLHSLKISDLSKCSDAIAKDPLTFGIACTQKLLDIHEITIEYTTEAARLKQDAQSRVRAQGGPEVDAVLANADLLVIMNATVLTMDSGDLAGDVYRNAVLFSRGGKIEAVMGAGEAVIPQGAMVLDAEGGMCLLVCSVETRVAKSEPCRVHHARVHRRTRTLERLRHHLPRQVVGDGDFPRVWCHHAAQVRFSLPYTPHCY